MADNSFRKLAELREYPIPIRVLPFDEHKAVDPEHKMPAAKTYAAELRQRFVKEMEQFMANPVSAAREAAEENLDAGANEEITPVDKYKTIIETVIERFCRDKKDIVDKIKTGGHPYYGVTKTLEDLLPPSISDRNKEAFKAVPDALDKALGKGTWAKESRPKKGKPGEFTQWVVLKASVTPEPPKA